MPSTSLHIYIYINLFLLNLPKIRGLIPYNAENKKVARTYANHYKLGVKD